MPHIFMGRIRLACLSEDKHAVIHGNTVMDSVLRSVRGCAPALLRFDRLGYAVSSAERVEPLAGCSVGRLACAGDSLSKTLMCWRES